MVYQPSRWTSFWETVGAAVFGIVLLAVLFPIFVRAHEYSGPGPHNGRMLAIAIAQYASDYNDTLPNCGGSPSKFQRQFQPYVVSERDFICGSDQSPRIQIFGNIKIQWSAYGLCGSSIAMNPMFSDGRTKLSAIPMPGRTIAVYDVWPFLNGRTGFRKMQHVITFDGQRREFHFKQAPEFLNPWFEGIENGKSVHERSGFSASSQGIKAGK